MILFDIETQQCGAYIIRHCSTGMLYVGSTKDLYKRKSVHLSLLYSGKHFNIKLQELFNDNPNIEFLEYPTENREDAYTLEQTYIDKNINSGLLCNLALDAKKPKNGFIVSEETKEKLRNASLGNTVNIGRKLTVETKEKIRITKNNNTKKIIINNVVYDSINEAVLKLGLTYTTISNRIRSNSKSFKDWTWY